MWEKFGFAAARPAANRKPELWTQINENKMRINQHEPIGHHSSRFRHVTIPAMNHLTHACFHTKNYNIYNSVIIRNCLEITILKKLSKIQKKHENKEKEAW